MGRVVKKILVPVDGSPSASRAAGVAAELAEELHATLTLLHVHYRESSELVGFQAVPYNEVVPVKENLGRWAFDSAEAAMGAAPALTQHVVAIGDPANEILIEAEKEGADLIVMGSRGQSPIRQLILGSVSTQVIRRAHCPVTIVR